MTNKSDKSWHITTHLLHSVSIRTKKIFTHAGARWYNPRLGRFWSLDPMAGEFPAWSPYNYALNDPLVYIDPSGEIPLGIIRRIGKFGLKFAKTRSVDAAMEAVTGGIREDFGTVIDSEASFGDRALAAGSLALELFSPVTGRDVKATGNAFGFGKSADNVGDAAKGGSTVYASVSKGVTKYVGITNNVARRSAEQLASKGIYIQPLMRGLSRTDARAVEQALIEIHGLGKNGGTLLNRINSISPKNPAYGSQLQRGYDLLKSIGY